jgi:hypothetical protein
VQSTEGWRLVSAPFYRLCLHYIRSHFPPPGIYVERRWAQFAIAIRRRKGIHTLMWKKHLEIFLRCWVIWKKWNIPPPPPPQIWHFPHVWESPNPGAVQGGRRGVAWVALWQAFPQTQELVFWLFLRSYLTSGLFSCWYFLLIKQRFFWYYFSCKVMAILCCVAQKAVSAAQTLFYFLKNGTCWIKSSKCLVIWPEFYFVQTFFPKRLPSVTNRILYTFFPLQSGLVDYHKRVLLVLYS